MKRRLLQALGEADSVIALGIAVVVGILGLLNVTSQAVATNAILVTLALLAVAVLRDRSRRGASEREAERGMQNLAAEVRMFATRLEQFAPVKQALEDAQRALSQISAIKMLSGPEVAKAHAEAREHTDRWIFKGGTGTFTRAVTLPAIYSMARKERRGVMIRLEILDPTDNEVCDRYARFRRSVSETPDGTGEPWTVERAHEESYATILAACWYQERFRLLDIRVGLTSNMSTFRYDMSSSALIVTQDDARIPALLITRDNFLYDSFDTEIRTSLEQARQVRLEEAADVGLSEEPTETEVMAVFERLRIPFILHAESVPRVIQKAIHARNPYS